MRALLLIIPFVAVLSLPCAAFAQVRSGPEQLKAAERSFSDVPFGATLPQPTLTIIDEDGCRQWDECNWRDDAGVEHYFWDGEVVVKTAEAGDLPIAALGIGDARAMDEVLARVRRFLPEAAINCREFSDSPGLSHVCGATLGEGWITLTFDSARRLIEVKVDAYHFT